MTPALSDHFNGKTFFQSHHATTRLRAFWRWRLTRRVTPWPSSIQLPPQPPPPPPRGDEVVVTWIGHASFLLQCRQGNLLIDPIFSERTSPVQWAGPRRVHPPGMALAALPRIDAVLVSHDHYDHCDMPSLRAVISKHGARFIAPLRHEDLARKAGATNVTTLDWCEMTRLGPDATITLTPSKHWSNRFGTPRNHRLWGGFYLNLGPAKIWFLGDSGYDAAMFRSVRERFGPPALALIPIGAYEPRWFMAPMHMNPTEAVQVHRDVGAGRSVGMHWGTFQLTDEGREEPVTALAEARLAAGLHPEDFRVVAPGESIVVN